MMAFITHYWKNARFNLIVLLLGACLVGAYPGSVRAESPTAEISLLKFERDGDAVLLTANIKFDLSSAVEQALLKGVAMIFVAQADVLRERWYWTNQKMSHVERHMRLAYQPLTGRWRLNVTSGQATSAGLGLALNQNFDSLPDALLAVQRLSRWKISDVAELDLEQRYFVDFRFRLDISQLPRPFQIGTLGQSEWDIAASSRQVLHLEGLK